MYNSDYFGSFKTNLWASSDMWSGRDHTSSDPLKTDARTIQKFWFLRLETFALFICIDLKGRIVITMVEDVFSFPALCGHLSFDDSITKLLGFLFSWVEFFSYSRVLLQASLEATLSISFVSLQSRTPFICGGGLILLFPCYVSMPSSSRFTPKGSLNLSEDISTNISIFRANQKPTKSRLLSDPNYIGV